jgi:hypothetical protein
MQVVDDLIPDKEKSKHTEIRDERFELCLTVRRPDGTDGSLAGIEIVHADALCKMLYRPTVLKILAQDLRLPVKPLQELASQRDPRRIANAIQSILGYLDHNPAFFTYRFGPAEGRAMEAGLRELRAAALRAAASGCLIFVTPVRRYAVPNLQQAIVESNPGQPHRW